VEVFDSIKDFKIIDEYKEYKMHETINQRSRLASKIADRLEQTLNDKNEGLQKVKKRETI
jgi:hypothetical protein